MSKVNPEGLVRQVRSDSPEIVNKTTKGYGPEESRKADSTASKRRAPRTSIATVRSICRFEELSAAASKLLKLTPLDPQCSSWLRHIDELRFFWGISQIRKYFRLNQLRTGRLKARSTMFSLSWKRTDCSGIAPRRASRAGDSLHRHPPHDPFWAGYTV